MCTALPQQKYYNTASVKGGKSNLNLIYFWALTPD